MNNVLEKYKKIPLSLKVSLAYAMCSVIQQGLTFLTMPFFARVLTKTQYGQVTIYSSWQGILSIFLTLNLAYGSFSTAMVKFENDRNGYISSIEGICLALSSVFLLIYLPFHSLWNILFELPTYIVCIMVIEILCITSLQLWNGKNRFEFKYRLVVAITLCMSVVSVILQYLFVTSNDEKGYARIMGAAISTISFGFFFLIRNIVKGKKTFNKEYWKYAFGFNVPLLAYYISQIIFNQSDRIMISHLVGTDKAAEYGVAYNLAMVLTFVLNAINNSYIPWFYGKIKSGNVQENRKVSISITCIMSILVLGVIWFAPEIISVMAGKKYVEAVYVVPPVAMSLILLFYSQLFINVEFYYEEKKKLVWASIGAALSNVILNYIFIRRFGFIAAAYTTLVSYIIFAVSNYLVMKKLLKEKNIEDKAYNYKGLIVVFAVFVVCSIVGSLLYEFLIVRSIISLIVVIVILINLKNIKNVLVVSFRKDKN